MEGAFSSETKTVFGFAVLCAETRSLRQGRRREKSMPFLIEMSTLQIQTPDGPGCQQLHHQSRLLNAAVLKTLRTRRVIENRTSLTYIKIMMEGTRMNTLSGISFALTGEELTGSGELLVAEQSRLLVEIRHTDHRTFRDELRRRLAIVEHLVAQCGSRV
jgi:hypothetical protein